MLTNNMGFNFNFNFNGGFLPQIPSFLGGFNSLNFLNNYLISPKNLFTPIGMPSSNLGFYNPLPINYNFGFNSCINFKQRPTITCKRPNFSNIGNFNTGYGWQNMGLNLTNTTKTNNNIGTTSISGLQSNKLKSNRSTQSTPISRTSNLFDKNVQYVTKKVTNGPMPYLIIGPKDVKPGEKLPVLMHLHGAWEVGSNLDNFNHQYDPQYIVKHWGLTNFRGYIICPLLKGGDWISNKHKVMGVYDDFKSKHINNIDERKVAISGFSLGAIGALSIAKSRQSVFKKAVLFSPYRVSGKSNIPVRSYVGTVDDVRCRNYQNQLKREIGNNNCIAIKGGHVAVPGGAFKMDSNGNGRSDLIEWLFA